MLSSEPLACNRLLVDSGSEPSPDKLHSAESQVKPKGYSLALYGASKAEFGNTYKLDDEWPESIFHHVGNQSASYPVSV